MEFDELLSKAWGPAAKSQNATLGYKAMEIVLFDKTAIPDPAFITDINMNEQ